MDYVNIGAIGFAQVGSNDYFDKRAIEKKVLTEYIETKTEIFKIQGMCHFHSKRFPYEDTSYDEIVLAYDNNLVDDWESEHDEAYEEADFEEGEDPDLFESRYTRFWDFANKCERIDLETDELMEQCRIQYAKSIKLQRLPDDKKSDNDEESTLKAV